VPAIAVGYSIKAHGIASDLGMGGHVVNAKNIISGTELVAAFHTLVYNEKSIAVSLKEQIPQYIRNATKKEALSLII
jgi:hypothetical protein